MKTLMIAAAAAIASPVSAEDWRLVNWDSETVLYIDHARLTRGRGPSNIGRASSISKTPHMRKSCRKSLCVATFAFIKI